VHARDPSVKAPRSKPSPKLTNPEYAHSIARQMFVYNILLIGIKLTFDKKYNLNSKLKRAFGNL